MCGIAGYIDFSGKPLDRETFEVMTRRLAHRGPDDQGIEVFQGVPYVALGHRRLSIIDLSSAGHQPMKSSDASKWIIYNGEIYNFQEIRKELEAKGHRFCSGTDTEVILCSYEEWGEECLQRFNGMFAFAIWDTRKQVLFAARDRMGVKPFYYYHDNNRLCFASEIKAMLPAVETGVDPKGLRDFLLLQYVPWPNTTFRGILKLPPAHFMHVDKNGIAIKRYWQVPIVKNRNISYCDAQDTLRDLLEDSVRLRMISDVPLGTFLSGGIDSAVITWLASKQVDTLNTYTIGFDEEKGKYDETKYARLLSDHIGVNSNVINVCVSNAVTRIPELIWNLDEPIAESLIYPFNELSMHARRDFTVALSGEGSDEFLYGYRRYSFERFRRSFPSIRPFDWLRGREDLRLRLVAMATGSSPEAGLNMWLPNFNRQELNALFGYNLDYPELATCMRERIGGDTPLDPLDYAPWLDEHFRLVDYLLTSRDKMSMAASLELRVPFLDFRLVEFMGSLPREFKMRNGEEKSVLKDAFKGLIPDSIIRRKKKAFAAPIEVWLKPLCEMYLVHSRLVNDGILTDNVKKYVLFGTDGKAKYPRKLWTLVMAEIWYRVFFCNSYDYDSSTSTPHHITGSSSLV